MITFKLLNDIQTHLHSERVRAKITLKKKPLDQSTKSSQRSRVLKIFQKKKSRTWNC